MILSQIKNRLVPAGVRPYRVPLGACRGVRFNMDLRTNLGRYCGLYEHEVTPWLWRLSRGIRTAIDIGAADGWYTMSLLRHTQAERVIAFEPQWAGTLLPNLAINDESVGNRLELRHEWVSDSAESVAKWTTGEPAWTTLSALAWTFPSPCLIKIDVDGGEADVLRGVGDLWGMPRLRWIVETHSLELERECSAILRTHGYAVQVIPNAWWRALARDQRPIEHNRWIVAGSW